MDRGLMSSWDEKHLKKKAEEFERQAQEHHMDALRYAGMHNGRYQNNQTQMQQQSHQQMQQQMAAQQQGMGGGPWNQNPWKASVGGPFIKLIDKKGFEKTVEYKGTLSNIFKLPLNVSDVHKKIASAAGVPVMSAEVITFRRTGLYEYTEE